MIKRWLRVYVVLIFFNILLAQVNESLESEIREKYSFTYFGAETESTENPKTVKTTETDYDVQTEKYQQIDCNLLGDFLEEVDSKFIQSGVSQFFMKYNDWEKSFKPVVDESSSFPQEVVAALEKALYQCDCSKPDRIEFFGEKKDYESLIKLGLNDLYVDSEEIDVLFPKISAVSRYNGLDEKYDYLKDFYGIPDNCRNIFHVAGEKDYYIFVYDPDGGFIGERFLVRLAERRGDEFTQISEFELTWEELNKSDCGVIQCGKEFYFVYFQYNKNECEFDSIKAHRMNSDPKEDTLVIRYLPENYILDTVYSAEDHIDDMYYWDKFIVEMGAKLFRGNYLRDETGAVPEIYYGDGEKPVSDNIPGLGVGVREADIANCDLPVYIWKKYGSECLEVSFYYYDSKRNLVKLSDLSVDELSQSNVDLVQLWFQEIEGTTYAFRLYHVSEYNYLLNVLLLKENRATIIRTLALSPTRKFVLTEGGTKEYEEPSLERLEKVLAEDEHYKIAYIGNYTYYFAIYNSQGEIVDERETRTSNPHIKYIDDTTIRIQVGMGTNALWTIYYDTLNDRFSEDCYNPLTEEYGKVVYLTWQEGEIYLVVQDIFDKESYYEEISLDFSHIVTPVKSARFLDENRLYVSYLSGESMENKDVELELGR